ncbi:MAG: 2-hydroxyacid dehydrogenase [Nitrososphaerota archaeon]
MARPIVLSYFKLDQESRAPLERIADVRYVGEERRLDEILTETVAVICIDLPLEHLTKMRMLRMIQSLSAGVDTLPWQHLPEDVVICGNMGSNAESVAEHAWALILALSRRLHLYLPNVRAGNFSSVGENITLSGKTLGILGLGSIGGAVAAVGKALDMRVLGVTRSGRSRYPCDFVGGEESLEYVLRESDVLVIASPLTKRTRGIINLERLRMLKTNAILVNVGRAEIIDRDDLLTYLRENPEANIATDVWWKFDGGRPTESELTRFPNFIGTPWVAGAFGSSTVLRKMMRLAAENVARFLKGEKPINIIDRSEYV